MDIVNNIFSFMDIVNDIFIDSINIMHNIYAIHMILCIISILSMKIYAIHIYSINIMHNIMCIFIDIINIMHNIMCMA